MFYHMLYHMVCLMFLVKLFPWENTEGQHKLQLQQVQLIRSESGICGTMDAPIHSDCPTKRRRTKNRTIQEGDEATAEGFLITKTVCDTDHGPVEEVTRHPIWKHTTQPEDNIPDIPSSREPEYNSLPDGAEYNDLADSEHAQAQKTQHYYLQEFVNWIHPLLNVLLSHEVMLNQ